MTVLVTRPRQQSLGTARRLHVLGHRALIDPLLVIQPLPYPRVEPDGLAALLLTSANGAVGIDSRLRASRIFAVGKATAAAAVRRGCSDVVVAAGDGVELANLVASTLAPGAGTIVHMAGEEHRPELGQILEAAGYDYRHVPVYRAVAATGFNHRTQHELRNRTLKVVLLYSPRTAEIFKSLATSGGLIDGLERAAAICISDAVADRIDDLPWSEIFVSARRDQEAMLACLESVSRTC